MTLAVVIPIYNEHDTLPELFSRLRAAFSRLPADLSVRVIYVNDGSTDASLEIMRAQQREDPRFSVLSLSRNFGQMAAITAGLADVDADAVVVLDGDLQDPPEVIPELVEAWRAGAEVVAAQRRSRAEHGLRRFGFEAFHRLLQWLGDHPIPPQTGIFGLLDRRALAALNRLPERNRFFPGLRAWIGFDATTVFYDRKERAAGQPKQDLGRLVRYALDGIFSFSYKPLRMMVLVGAAISSYGFGLAFWYIGKRLLGVETAQTGFTTLVTLVLFLGGVQLVAIGLLGEYLGRIYDEVKQRPLYIVKDRFPGDDRS